MWKMKKCRKLLRTDDFFKYENYCCNYNLWHVWNYLKHIRDNNYRCTDSNNLIVAIIIKEATWNISEYLRKIDSPITDWNNQDDTVANISQLKWHCEMTEETWTCVITWECHLKQLIWNLASYKTMFKKQ